jgi:nitrite reductase (NADH) small subunit
MISRLGSSALIPVGEGRTFVIDGVAIAVFRARDGRTFATEAYCPHRGGPLADGIVGAGSVICPLHARRFDLASGACADGSCASLVTFNVIEREGDLFVELPNEPKRTVVRLGLAP